MNYLDDAVFYPALAQRAVEVDADLLLHIRELTADNRHDDSLSALAAMTGDSNLIAEVEAHVARSRRGLSRLTLLRKVCLCLPGGYHFYRAC